METKILDKVGFSKAVCSLPHNPVVHILFAGDRFYCCDEAVAVYIENKVVALASIAPKGEEGIVKPTIVGVYVHPNFRGQGFGKVVFEAVINRCLERGFAKIYVEVLSSYMMRIVDHLSPELRSVLDVRYLGSVMDAIPE